MKYLKLLIVLVVVLSACTETSNKEETTIIEFANIPGNEKGIETFQMAKTEVTNQQYVDFLNAAYKKGEVTIGEVEPLKQNSAEPFVPENLAKQMLGYKSKNQQLVFDKNGRRILDLLNIRMTGDHGYDGKTDRWEMKNPLNRCMIEFDGKEFKVVDPKKVDWNIYFDNSNLPNGIVVADKITNWGELHNFWPENKELSNREIVSFDKGDYDDNTIFAGNFDLDLKLPTIEEVKNWPIIYIEYYSAKVFAEFYGYDLPTIEQYKWVVDAGKGYKYGTSDGTINPENCIYNGHSIKNDYTKLPKGGLDHTQWPGQHKGHVQAVDLLAPNPFGVYDLSGNVIEWTQSKNKPEYKCRSKVSSEYETYITVSSGWTYPEEYASYDKLCFTETNVGATNDHFGFRVVKNNKKIEPIEFANIPGNEKGIETFQMAKTEVTNQQYVDFLNAAYKKGEVTVGEVEQLDEDQLLFAGHKSKNQQCVYDKDDNRLVDLLGIRVTGDHNHNGKFELWEMENPLNRIMIEFDKIDEEFSVVDPKDVDWTIYFDKKNLPEGIEPVDNIMNWAELHQFWTSEKKINTEQIVTWNYGNYNSDVLFAGHLDLDAELPTLKEVKNWPANHIEYYGAKAFADFYDYELPTLSQIQWAGAGGKNYEYATNDGTINSENVVYSGHSFDEYPKGEKRPKDGGQTQKPQVPNFSKFPGKDKGHVQEVASFPPNPYGIFDLSGNVYEWTKSTLSDYPNAIDRTGNDTEAYIRIGGSWNYYDEAQLLITKEAKNTGAHRGNDHFGFRVVKNN